MPGSRKSGISINLCVGCHPSDSHVGSAAHQGILSADFRERAEKAGLPLDDDGRMGCATCHDPHPAGILPGTEVRKEHVGDPLVPERWREQVLLPALESQEQVSAGQIEHYLQEADLLRLSVHDSALCQACHGTGGSRQRHRRGR